MVKQFIASYLISYIALGVAVAFLVVSSDRFKKSATHSMRLTRLVIGTLPFISLAIITLAEYLITGWPSGWVFSLIIVGLICWDVSLTIRQIRQSG